jgi:hypothetical protein
MPRRTFDRGLYPKQLTIVPYIRIHDDTMEEQRLQQPKLQRTNNNRNVSQYCKERAR